MKSDSAEWPAVNRTLRLTLHMCLALPMQLLHNNPLGRSGVAKLLQVCAMREAKYVLCWRDVNLV